MRGVTLVGLCALAACHPAPAAAPAPPIDDTGVQRPPPPERGRTVVTETSIEIIDRVEFDGVTSVLTKLGRRKLDMMAETMLGNPGLQLVEVDAYGIDAPAPYQKQLGEARARAIVDYLVAHGVAAARLQAAGNAQPPATHRDARPTFLVLRRSY